MSNDVSVRVRPKAILVISIFLLKKIDFKNRNFYIPKLSIQAIDEHKLNKLLLYSLAALDPPLINS
jgi:hypothetical protein